MPAGVKLWGLDKVNDEWIPIRVLPDGSLSITASMTIDEGVATGGTINSVVDATKNWEVDVLEGALVEVIHAGISYLRTLTSNTNDDLVYPAVTPAIVAGDVYRIIKQVDPMTPQSRGVIHNTAYVAPADFLGAAIAPMISPSLFRCQGAFSVAGVLYGRITRAANTQQVEFNHGVVLPANALFEFDMLVEDGDTINYRYSVNCTILTFKVLEIPSAI
jgi:hypothetical protein